MSVFSRVTILDGAFGTELVRRGAADGGPGLNLDRPALVREIHRSYAEAGCDVVYTNTFGADAGRAGTRLGPIIRAGIAAAREAAPGCRVALDIGPLGRLMAPSGDTSFAEAYEMFAEIVALGRDADLVVVETMTDLAELRAALLAVRENCSLPLICSMSFQADGRTFQGTPAAAYALTAAPLADALGINCSAGPEATLPAFRELARFCDKPLWIKLNAGLPDGEGRYSLGPEAFAEACEEYYRLGAVGLGGCCGTTPAHIAALQARFGGREPVKRSGRIPAALCSATRAVTLEDVHVIGERINPTGKKRMQEALRARDFGYVAEQALAQTEAGADFLDVNCGLPGLDEASLLPELVEAVQRVTAAPLVIDSADPAALARALRAYVGKACVNSVDGSAAGLAAILPLARRYGAAVVGLCVDERGVPATAAERVAIAARIADAARAQGIPERDLYLDCLTMAVSADQTQARETLAAIRTLKKRYPEAHFVLGVSNISFGLPARIGVNAAFLAMALEAGLDLPILNPNLGDMMRTVDAGRVLAGTDAGCARYVAKYADAPSSAPPAAAAPARRTLADELAYAVEKGLPAARELCARLFETMPPLAVAERVLIPALDRVGALYESGRYFLPQLMAAGESAKACFEEIRRSSARGTAERGEIVLATVEGDVHDIGKNIVGTVLASYGFGIVDLGKNVPCARVAEVCAERGARLCGLSALMTTTVPAMRETARLVRERCPGCRIMVGGAVLNEALARSFGAEYARDANASVRIAEEVFGRAERRGDSGG